MIDLLMSAGLTTGLFVDVWNCQASLAFSAGLNSTRYLADAAYSDALHEELLDVIEELGGAVNVSGRYHIPAAMLASGRFPHIAAALMAGPWE